MCAGGIATVRDQVSDVCSLDGKFWEFIADLAKGDTAYTNIALGAHTDNTYFVRQHTTGPVPCPSDTFDTLDRPFWTPTLPPPLTHGWIRRRNAPSRRVLRRVDPERPSSRIVLTPLRHPNTGTRGWGRNSDLPAFAEIWVPGFEPRPCDGGVVSGEVEQRR